MRTKEELAEARSALAAAQKDGWVLVPKEPTMGMWDDFCAVQPVRFDLFIAAYKAMLAAIDSARGAK